MKFVALLSGGKDSCCNVWKCEQEGHELVCLANLCPPEGTGEELNSFMYQSAAHGVIPQLAECFGVPLIRQEITGSAVCQDLDYIQGDDDTASRDEVEDLYELLLKVGREYPEVKGVSCGAILSTYQRLRVEDVCKRLSLTPLTYLWQMDRNALLDDLCNNNFEVVLVKVAGAGLEPYKHLGKKLSALRPQLHTLHHNLGLDLCGEGGEYESLVLDCPMFARTGKRLRIVSSEVLLDEEDCSVGNLLIKECVVEYREEEEEEDSADDNHVIISRNSSGVMMREFDAIRNCAAALAVQAAAAASQNNKTSLQSRQSAWGGTGTVLIPTSLLQGGNDSLDSTSITATPPGGSVCPGGYGNTGLLLPTGDSSTGDSATIREQLRSIFSYLPSLLASVGVSKIEDATFIHLYLRHMHDFAAVNEE